MKQFVSEIRNRSSVYSIDYVFVREEWLNLTLFRLAQMIGIIIYEMDRAMCIASISLKKKHKSEKYSLTTDHSNA